MVAIPINIHNTVTPQITINMALKLLLINATLLSSTWSTDESRDPKGKVTQVGPLGNSLRYNTFI